jgi:hypothetical protein
MCETDDSQKKKCVQTPTPGSSSENPFIAGPIIPGPKEHWEMVRSAVVHEDNLVNHRLVWLLTGHAFLFVSFGAVQNAVLTNKISSVEHVTLEVVLAFVFIGALAIARVVGISISLATAHNRRLEMWWCGKHDQSTASVDLSKAKIRTWRWWHWWKDVGDSLKEPDVLPATDTQPPIHGTFINLPWFSSFVCIPIIFILIDALLAGACVLLAFSALPSVSEIDEPAIKHGAPLETGSDKKRVLASPNATDAAGNAQANIEAATDSTPSKSSTSNEQSHALEPANGPVSNGSSSPPAK